MQYVTFDETHTRSAMCWVTWIIVMEKNQKNRIKVKIDNILELNWNVGKCNWIIKIVCLWFCFACCYSILVMETTSFSLLFSISMCYVSRDTRAWTSISSSISTEEISTRAFKFTLNSLESWLNMKAYCLFVHHFLFECE